MTLRCVPRLQRFEARSIASGLLKLDAGGVAAADPKRSCGSNPVRALVGESDPIRLLASEQRALIDRHLARLTPDDRRLRFGSRMNDALIARYVAGIDFSLDQMFGVFAADSTLIGLAHLALDPVRGFAEIGLSVDLAYRNRGHGYALLKRSIEDAASSGYRTLFMHCRSENEAIKRLARRLGLIVVATSGDADAQVELGLELHGTQFAKVTERPAVLMDSHFSNYVALSVEEGFSPPDAEPSGRPVPS